MKKKDVLQYEFAALRFPEDGNLRDRLYWYLADLPVREGDEVLAPVGPHDRLQRGVVERTVRAKEEEAPYDVRLIKRITARYGARKLLFAGHAEAFWEFGGARYDDRHYTRLGRILYTDTMSECAGMVADSACMTLFEAPMSEDEAIYRTLASGHAALLVGGEGREIVRLLLSLLKGEEGAADRLRAIGLSDREIAALVIWLG